MLALHRGGRRADPLGAYRALRGTLVEELGIEPGEAVRAAHQEILAADDEAPTPVRDEPAAVPWQRTLELADRHGLDHYRRLSRKGLDAFATGLSD